MNYQTKSLKIAITSLFRDSECFVEENFERIKDFQAHFSSVFVLTAENNSRDNTFESITKYSKGLDHTCFKIDDLDQRFPLRTERLAYLHNFLISQIKDVDYIITFDSDGLLTNFNIESLLSCFEYDWNQWDMMGANSTESYYDVWALRNHEIDFDCWDMVYHQTQMGMNRSHAIDRFVSKFQKPIGIFSDLIPVDSCFGGLAVYKYQSIKGCYRNGIRQTCDCKKHKVKGQCLKEVCEHVSFHREMKKKNNAKLFINPQMIVNCQTEHIIKRI
jgi:hypothetical protein